MVDSLRVVELINWDALSITVGRLLSVSRGPGKQKEHPYRKDALFL
jgi:hypothetical protein